MIIDVNTLQLINGLVVVVCSTSFILATVFRTYDRAGMLWSAAFVSGILSSLAYAVDAISGGGWGLLAIANGAFVLALGAMWSGMRLFTGKRAGIIWVIAATAAAGLIVPFEWERSGSWAGAWIFLLLVGIFAVLTAIECFRPRLRAAIHARVLGASLLAFGGYQFARTAAYFWGGPEKLADSVAFGSATATTIVMVVLVACSVSLSVLRAEADLTRRLLPVAETVAANFSLDVLSPAAFEFGAADRVRRANDHTAKVALIRARIDGLDDFRTSYGDDAMRETISRFARVLRSSVPPTAIIGHLGDGLFGVLAMRDDVTEGREVARSIFTTLAQHPLAPSQGLRMSASLGVAEHGDDPIDWEKLTITAVKALEQAEYAGGNRIAELSVANLGSREEQQRA